LRENTETIAKADSPIICQTLNAFVLIQCKQSGQLKWK